MSPNSARHTGKAEADMLRSVDLIVPDVREAAIFLENAFGLTASVIEDRCYQSASSDSTGAGLSTLTGNWTRNRVSPGLDSTRMSPWCLFTTIR